MLLRSKQVDNIGLKLTVPEVRVRYYGAYASRRRGWWRRRGVVLAGAGQKPAHDEAECEVVAWPALKARRRRWAELLLRVFAVDVEVCPRCDGEMRIIAFVTEHASDMVSLPDTPRAGRRQSYQRS